MWIILLLITTFAYQDEVVANSRAELGPGVVGGGLESKLVIRMLLRLIRC